MNVTYRLTGSSSNLTMSILSTAQFETESLLQKITKLVFVTGRLVSHECNLPDKLFSCKYNFVNFVNCPISAGIAPTKNNKISICDWSVYR